MVNSIYTYLRLKISSPYTQNQFESLICILPNQVNKVIIFYFSDKDVKCFIELSYRSETKKPMYVWTMNVWSF